jgi:hypothetical protein
MLQISSFAIQLALNKHAWFCGAGRAVDSLGVLLFTGVSPDITSMGDGKQG